MESPSDNALRNQCFFYGTCRCGLEPSCMMGLRLPKTYKEKLFSEGVIPNPRSRGDIEGRREDTGLETEANHEDAREGELTEPIGE